MFSFRNSNSMGLVGCSLLALGFLARAFLGDGVVSWTLLTVAIGFILEWVAVYESAWVAALFYETGSLEIENEIYSPKDCLIRAAYLILVFGAAVVFGKAYLDVIPDTFLSLVAIILPIVIWVFWSGIAHWKAIRMAASKNGWRRRNS